MFEKCGLRDIFCGFRRSLWVIFAAMIVFGAAGGALYYRDLSKYNKKQEAAAGDTEVYAGYAYYYVAAKDGAILSAADQKRYTKSYVDLMTAMPSRHSILKKLMEKHTKEELIDLLDPAAYKNGVTKEKLWQKSYYVERWSSDNILRIKVKAVDEETARELMSACRKRLESIDKGTPDTDLVYEGEYFKTAASASVIMTEEKTSDSRPSARKILVWAAIGLFLGLLYSVIRSVLFPVINRPADFELYGLTPLGEINEKTVPLLARILEKMAGEEAKTVVFASGAKNAGKLKEFCASLCEEWKKLGRDVCTEDAENTQGKTVILPAVSPDTDAAASDRCEKADLVILAEVKGKSSHAGLEERKHYLNLLKIESSGAVLIS